MLIIHFYKRTDKMRLIYADYNPQTNSFDITTFENYILRIDCNKADGGFSPGQFWFLLYLLVISVVSVGIIALSKRFVSKAEITILFFLVYILGAPLPLLSELLSIGGKSLVEYTYLFFAWLFRIC